MTLPMSQGNIVSPPIPDGRDPIRIFEYLLELAREVGRERLPEPTAFALGTVDGESRPSVRMVLLKGLDERGFVFYTNFESRKGVELIANPQAAMCFHWQPLELQVRIEGRVTRVSDAEADEYFASRPRGSQLGAWASLQSRALRTSRELADRYMALEKEYDGKPIPRPPHWSGFRVSPERIEFWRGMPSRLHERRVYVREEAAWRVETLYP